MTIASTPVLKKGISLCRTDIDESLVDASKKRSTIIQAATGKKRSTEYFASKHILMLMPSQLAFRGDGFLSQHAKRHNRITNDAVNVMSVVARPECASITGSVAYIPVAKKAASGPPNDFAHTQTTNTEMRKTGNTKILAQTNLFLIRLLEK